MSKKIILTSVAIVLIAVGAGFYGGVEYTKNTRVIQITDSREVVDADFSLFWEAVQATKDKYVDEGKFNDQELVYGAIRGALATLKDPYTTFFSPSDARKFEEDLEGVFGGIGAEIGVRNNELLVIAPLKGNPAEEVGLKAGDKILKVDDTMTAGMAVEEAVKIIRGEPGTKVTLLIFREGFGEPKEFEITRRIIVVPTLDYEMKEGSVMYAHLYNFNGNAPSLFYEMGLNALVRGARGMVLDLRNNPGGFLDVATHLAGWFLDRGEVVVKERFRGGEEQPILANGNAALAKIPVVVIINGGSASASEILAGALRDIRGATLVGKKTFGKGSVQEIENLKDGATVKVTIAEWLTPVGTKIDGEGLTPDHEVQEGEEGEDPQLDKALELIWEQIGYQPVRSK
ncbi:MAG: S41 family peptidase [Candidatus Jorgensenbacteria bacterium]|nr:S41 family peptidase [Candidatus Jorgensenbacteria bacterium]